MIFSHSSAYAVRALVWLARKPRDSRWLVTDMAREEGIPRPYLSKVMGTLKGQGVVSACRGPKGGYTLAQDPADVTLRQVAKMFGSEDIEHTCLLAYADCGTRRVCPIEEFWKSRRQALGSFLDEITIAQLAERATLQEQSQHAK